MGTPWINDAILCVFAPMCFDSCYKDSVYETCVGRVCALIRQTVGEHPIGLQKDVAGERNVVCADRGAAPMSQHTPSTSFVSIKLFRDQPSFTTIPSRTSLTAAQRRATRLAGERPHLFPQKLMSNAMGSDPNRHMQVRACQVSTTGRLGLMCNQDGMVALVEEAHVSRPAPNMCECRRGNWSYNPHTPS